MQTPKVYFDEAGNTGDNLFDKDQPIYVLSSNNYSEVEIEDILFPLNQVNADELHFKRLKKYEKYKDALIKVFNHDLINSNRIKSSYADKRYALICNIVDKIRTYVL